MLHSQVSFPGGHIEAGEDSVEAALRETREEIGDSLGSVEVLGLGQTLTAGDSSLDTYDGVYIVIRLSYRACLAEMFE